MIPGDISHRFLCFQVLAVAARSALRNGAKRVLVVDWAVAHGIGTQRICFDDPSIVTVSM